MCKRALLLIVLLALLAAPAAAQQDAPFDPAAWIPADFAGFVRLEGSMGPTLTALHLATLVSQLMQPQRDFPTVNSLEDLISLTELDVDNPSFATDIVPWLSGDIILAYQGLGRNLQVSAEDAVLILPTRDMLNAASGLARVIQGQDLLDEQSYRNQRLYVGDKVTIVLLPQAVVIGGTALVKEVLDVQSGDAESLVDAPGYQAIQAASPANAIVSGYVDGKDALTLLSFAINANGDALPVLSAHSEALAAFRSDTSLEQLLLDEKVEHIGIFVSADTFAQSRLNVTLIFDAPGYDAPLTDGVQISSDVLDMLPQSAMVVRSGTDAREMAYDLLVALPLANFTGKFLSAFPVNESAASANDLFDVPDSTALEHAVGTFLSTLSSQENYDLDNDLLKHLDGSYTLAILPRPNDPLPPLNMPYDILLVAEVDDSAAAMDGARRLTQLLLAQDSLESSTVGDYQFDTLSLNALDKPVLHVGMVGNLLVFATGDALEQSLNAQRGDDRLTSRDRWQDVSGDWTPQLYVDFPAVYNTFIPQVDVTQVQQLIRQMAAQTRYLGEGLFEIDMTITLPSLLG